MLELIRNERARGDGNGGMEMTISSGKAVHRSREYCGSGTDLKAHKFISLRNISRKMLTYEEMATCRSKARMIQRGDGSAVLGP